MVVAGYILFAMLVLRFLVVLVNFISRPFLPKTSSLTEYPKVSILIPVRNEEVNLPKLLTDLKQLDYPNFEIIVCNDHSTDQTETILKETLTQFKQLIYFNNDELPKGWVGKNFACYQLGKRANGEFFLFLDADVSVRPQLVMQAISFAIRKELTLLSIFPQQIIESEGEWRTVPLMNWILLSFLPLPLVQWKWFPSLSAANGQFMLFESENYKQNEWHLQVKDQNVEDIIIAKTMKKQHFPIALLLGDNDILCQMYNSYNKAIKGFSLNIHQYFGGSSMWMIFYSLLAWCRLPFFVLSHQFIILVTSIILLVLMKLMVSSSSRQNSLRNLIMHWPQLISFTTIVFYNLKNGWKGNYEWKGRVYNT